MGKHAQMIAVLVWMILHSSAFVNETYYKLAEGFAKSYGVK